MFGLDAPEHHYEAVVGAKSVFDQFGAVQDLRENAVAKVIGAVLGRLDLRCLRKQMQRVAETFARELAHSPMSQIYRAQLVEASQKRRAGISTRA